jgi:hypothetical protein
MFFANVRRAQRFLQNDFNEKKIGIALGTLLPNRKSFSKVFIHIDLREIKVIVAR